jgi:hypothetical protein
LDGGFWTRPMNCRSALEILDCQGAGLSGVREGDLAAAEAHLVGCARCRAIVQNRRRLDRKIGRVLRAVNVPRGARERLFAQLAALETAAVASEPPEDRRTSVGATSPVEFRNEICVPPAITSDRADIAQGPAQGLAEVPSRPKRPLWRGLVPVAACLAVAAIGFFSVIWLMTPRWSVEEVRLQLARIDFDSIESLRDFNGKPAASRLPADPGWQKLEWLSGKVAKGLPDASSRHQFAVYGFVIPGRQRHPIRGLLAVVPRRQMRAPPTDESLSTAQSSDYLSARIGESVSVAWTDGDLVYVCLVEGGEDSLATLRQILGASAA